MTLENYTRTSVELIVSFTDSFHVLFDFAPILKLIGIHDLSIKGLVMKPGIWIDWMGLDIVSEFFLECVKTHIKLVGSLSDICLALKDLGQSIF